MPIVGRLLSMDTDSSCIPKTDARPPRRWWIPNRVRELAANRELVTSTVIASTGRVANIFYTFRYVSEYSCNTDALILWRGRGGTNLIRRSFFETWIRIGFSEVSEFLICISVMLMDEFVKGKRHERSKASTNVWSLCIVLRPFVEIWVRICL